MKEKDEIGPYRKHALILLRKLIIQILAKHPTGRTGIVLWGQARKSNAGYTLHEFDSILVQLRADGIVHCTNKRWWLTDSSRNNWQKIINE